MSRVMEEIQVLNRVLSEALPFSRLREKVPRRGG